MTETMETMDKAKKEIRLPGVYGNLDLNSRITKFQEKAEQHREKQKLNPFSSSFDAVAAAKQKLSKDDPK